MQRLITVPSLILVFIVCTIGMPGVVSSQTDIFDASEFLVLNDCICAPGDETEECVDGTVVIVQVDDQANHEAVMAPVVLDLGRNEEMFAWRLQISQSIADPVAFPPDQKYGLRLTSSTPIEFLDGGTGGADFVRGTSGVSKQILLIWNSFPEELVLAGRFPNNDEFSGTMNITGPEGDLVEVVITDASGGCDNSPPPVDRPDPEIPEACPGTPEDDGDDDDDT